MKHYTLNFEEIGEGRPVVLVSGIMSSTRYWYRFAEFFDTAQYKLIPVDLLGFGKSPKPRNISYTYEEHRKSLYTTLSILLAKEKAILVGFSMGALLLTNFARHYSGLVERIVLVSPPVFPDTQVTIRDLSVQSKSYRMVKTPILGRMASGMTTGFKPIFRKILPYFLTHVTPEIAADVPNHCWKSLQGSLKNVVEVPQFKNDIRFLDHVDIDIAYSTDDEYTREEYLLPMVDGMSNVKIHTINGSHQIPLDSPHELAGIIKSSE
ncbi:MAG: alpha/beta fold hydrolase [Candidatus Dojkabacteria bacterium]